MKRILFFTIFLASFLSLSAQHEWDQWRFGSNCAMSFTGGAPVNVPPCNIGDSLYLPLLGCSSIADRNGNLLLCTDGKSVWDRSCTITPHGDSLKTGPVSYYQTSLILPMPGDTDLYYIFTSAWNYGINQPYDTGYYYSIFDRRLHGGLGDVTAVKNVLLSDSNTAVLSATHNASHTGFWIVTHRLGDLYASYELTRAGLSAPVYSHTGDTVPYVNTINHGSGATSFTMDGRRLAMPIGRRGQFQICDFDPVTGIVSGAIIVGPVSTTQQTEFLYTIFSPDGTKLYATENAFGQVWQFDVTSHSAAAIAASHYTVYNAHWSSKYAGMQNGPDGKIYIAENSRALAVINHPDAAGAACGFADSAFWLGGLGPVATIGLPNIVFSSFGTPLCQPGNTPINGAICVDVPYDFHGRQLSSPGIYRDTLRSFYGCDSVVTLHLTIQQPPAVTFSLRPLLQRGSLHVSDADTFVCAGDPSFLLTGGYPLGGSYSGAAVMGSRYTPPAISGTSAISYTYTDTTGCAALSRKVIQVRDCTTGIDDLSAAAAISIYPEPSAGIFTLHTSLTPDSYYLIRDLSGRIIQHSAIAQEDQRIDLSDKASGTYLLTVVSDEKTQTVKVTVVR